jgi:hypothetical protein
MRAGVGSVEWPETAVETNPDKPGPIRPQGVSPRLSLILLIAIVAALAIGYRYVTDSEMYRTAETFVRQNDAIRNTFGEVRRCRLWFPFSVDFPDNAPRIHMTLKIEGAKADTNVYVTLARKGAKWHVVAASYGDGRGQVRPL